MMRQMRDNMKWIMGLTAVTFVGLMVFGWGMDITGRTGTDATGGELGRVNGEPITYEQWQSVYRNLYETRQRQSNAPVNAAVNKAIEEDAWNQIIMQKLINQELERRGIDVSESEIKQAARFAPPPEFSSNEMFQTNGQFDLNKYHEFMSSPNANDELLLQLESYYRELIPRSKLYYQVTTGTYLPDGELWRMWKDGRETAKIRYILIDPGAVVPDNQVTIETREVERYYRDHEDEFERPAAAKVKFVTLDRTPNAADTAAARTRAQRVRQELLGGARWDTVAKRESADSGSANNGGKLTLQKGQAVPAFDQAAFSIPLNQMSDLIETMYGFHMMKVTSRTDKQVELLHVLIPIELSEDHEAQLLARADSLDDLGSTKTLDQAASTLGLTVRTGELQPTFAFLPGVGQIDEGAVWVFDEAEVGEVSEVFETPTTFYMLEVTEKTPKGMRTLEEARPAIEATLKQEKKLESAREVARKAVDLIRGGATLDAAAKAINVTVQDAGPFTRLDFLPGIGRANAATGTAFGLKPNQISGVVESEGGLFIIQTLEKNEPNRAEWEQQKEVQRTRIAEALAEQRWNQYLEALRKTAKIVDNRDKVLRQPGDTTAIVR